MAYVDEGEGDPIIFIHGAPESAYIWHNILPFLQPYGCIIAPEHIGHGKSDKPDVKYEFADYIKYLDGFIDELGLTNMTFVIHDWGSVLGLYYGSRFPEKVRGIAMMEAVCAPYYPITNIPEALKRKGKAGVIHHYQLDKSDAAHDLAIKQNMFIEQVLMLSQCEMDNYRNPFHKEEWRMPLFMWAREVGLEGDCPLCV